MLKSSCLAAAVLAFACPAIASSPPLPMERTISVTGVDFTDPASVRLVYARLQAAASAVCDGYRANSRVSQRDIACADRVLAAAVRTLDRPVVSALYERRGTLRIASATAR
jgi:UrcA family protein